MRVERKCCYPPRYTIQKLRGMILAIVVFFMWSILQVGVTLLKLAEKSQSCDVNMLDINCVSLWKDAHEKLFKGQLIKVTNFKLHGTVFFFSFVFVQTHLVSLLFWRDFVLNSFLEDRVWHLWKKKKPFDRGSGLSSPLFLSNGKYILGIIPYHKSSLSLNQVQFTSQIEVSSDFSLFIE